jgi:hypothetical protein
VTFLPYRITRRFGVEGGDERELSHLLELPIPPAKGQWIEVPDVAEPLTISRVIVTARIAAPAWEPGFLTVQHCQVVLEREAPDGYETALAAGWTPSKD